MRVRARVAGCAPYIQIHVVIVIAWRVLLEPEDRGAAENVRPCAQRRVELGQLDRAGFEELGPAVEVWVCAGDGSG